MAAWRWGSRRTVATGAALTAVALAVSVVPTGRAASASGGALLGGDAEPRIGIDDVVEQGGSVHVVGWAEGGEPPIVVVRSGDVEVQVQAVGARVDRDVAYPNGDPHWGFVAELAASESAEVCASTGDDVACRQQACHVDVFGRTFAAELARRYRTPRFTAHVVDTRTNCEYELQPGLRLTTASVIKLEVLGDLLLDAQRAGRRLTSLERRRAKAMMRHSLNAPTAWLYGRIGGAASLSAHSASVGATATTHTPRFGATVSTAADRTAVALAVLDRHGKLHWDGIETAWEIMRGVSRPQQWGISAGVPAGWDVAHKNGFYPHSRYRWRVGSTGFVADPGGGGYGITILTDFNDTQADGVALVEEIAAHVAARLTAGAPARRGYDEITCTTVTSRASWASVTADLGLAKRHRGAVRRAAGGDGPLQGQQVCTP